MRSRRLAHLIPALCCLAAGSAPGRGAQEQEPAPEADIRSKGTIVMDAVANEFCELEDGLARQDTAAVAAAAERLHTVLRSPTGLRPQENTDLQAEFQRLIDLAAGTSQEIAALATDAKLPLARQAFEDLRGTCITCHVKFNAHGTLDIVFPARRTVIAGEVRVRTTAGAKREDRSNVLVFLEGGPEGVSWPRARKNPLVAQKDLRFEPKVLPVLRGTTVDFPNNDSVFHNVFSLSKSRPFDLGTYKQGNFKSITFDDLGQVRLYCNIHPQMIATVVVLENPLFALTDVKGLFVIPEVPDGNYVLRTWHEYGGETREELSVSEAAILQRTLSIQEERATLERMNKHGQAYHGKF